jgi:hypothetical protein
MVLSEARGLRLFSVVQGGIGLHRRLAARRQKRSLTLLLDTLPRTRASRRTRLATRQKMILGDETDSSAKDAQAACGFKCLASKRTSFFQTINVIAAIFRAKVRRAMVGFLPLTSKAS